MKTIRISLIFLTLIFSGFASAQDGLNLRLVRGTQDTVYNKTHYLIGHVEPGSQVEINNQQVKVYKTGSFGIALDLQKGNNPIVVKATNPKISPEASTVSRTIYYSDRPASMRPQLPVEEKDTLFNVITKNDAYLNFGDGTDRLGGAKINYISEGIVMQVVSIHGNLYQVKLSDNRYAFIPQSCCEATAIEPVKSLTGSWNVSNAGNEDKVFISLNTRLPYTTKEKRFPTRIEVDIFGAKCNSNWITQMLDTEMIESVDFEQVDSEQFRAVIYLQKKYSWGYHVKYEGNNLAIYVKHEPNLSLKGLKIGIDAGHGGPANGAMSPSGLKEKELNLEMTYMLKQMLEKEGATVVLSRVDDSDISQADRKAFFISNKVDLSLSIHCNASGNPLISMGSSTYYKQIHNREFAKLILERLLELGVPNYGLVGNFNFSQNAMTEFPNILVETLFMSSLPDEELLADRKFKEQMMKKVLQGIKDYLKLCQSN